MKEDIEYRTYYVDLWPGWQDNKGYNPALFGTAPTHPAVPRDRRIKIQIPLPAFGGSLDAEEFNPMDAAGAGFILDEVRE